MKKIELIYLACPFRHIDPMVQKKRCAAAHYVAAMLSAQGRHIFSPLTHNEILMEIKQDIPGEHWMQFDLTILAICRRLLVLKMAGWELSKGVRREIDFAKERGIPIEEMESPEESQFFPLVRP
ncbi:MAG TPA: DUF1937 family protein [Chlamydiales bacterium]|nr:DUF1937 family protein [Chlamydiales bacterium]